MGSKYTTQSASGYNSSPPADDGSQVAANLVKWSTHKTKLADPIKTLADSINSALVTALDYSVRQITASDSVAASDHMKTVEIASTVTTAVTVTLGDAATLTNNFIVRIRNSSAINQTIARATGGDTIDGVAASVTLPPGATVVYGTNTGANGFLTLARTGPFLDTNALVTGSSDGTKKLRFEVDGLTTGNTRVMTVPDYDGTLATLAGSEELTNKTLNASVGKGTWTVSGTWTLPAVTLGGTVSGGGNQINNVIIGASTPLAGSFTTISATGTITKTNSAATLSQFLSVAGSTTAATYGDVTNTSGALRVGVESSAGGILATGSAAYASVVVSNSATKLQLGSNGVVSVTIDNSRQLTTDLGNTSSNIGVIGQSGTGFTGYSYQAITGTARGTGYNFFVGTNATASDIFIKGNGDIVNTNNSYGAISDVKLKQDIVDAGSAWDDIKAVRVRKFRLKSEVTENPDAKALIGVVAQELEQVMPGLIEESEDFETVVGESGVEKVATGEVTKSVKYSVLNMKMLKALQEAMARIEALEAR